MRRPRCPRRARNAPSSSFGADVDGKSTRVTLHHTGWGDGGEWDKAYAYLDCAWLNVLRNLKKRFDTGPIDWTDWLARLKKMHEAPPAAESSRTGRLPAPARRHFARRRRISSQRPRRRIGGP